MRPLCDKHRVPLQRAGGQWRCPFSHRPRFEERPEPMCRKCRRDRVYAEGLCYQHWYYR